MGLLIRFETIMLYEILQEYSETTSLLNSALEPFVYPEPTKIFSITPIFLSVGPDRVIKSSKSYPTEATEMGNGKEK